MNELPPFALWAEAFLWTLALETPLYLLWLRKRLPRWWAPLVVSLVVNVLTHPALWYLVPTWEPYHEYLYVVETGVTLVEAMLVYAVLRRAPVPAGALAHGFATSFSANAFSTIVGLRILG